MQLRLFLVFWIRHGPGHVNNLANIFCYLMLFFRIATTIFSIQLQRVNILFNFISMKRSILFRSYNTEIMLVAANNIFSYLLLYQKVRDHWEDLDVGGWTILEWILER
jgi:hypothetical protein